MNTATEAQEKTGIPCGVTVGTFDGVHRGHMMVIDTLQKECEQHGLVPLVITFDPHPLAVVCPERSPKLLESPEERESMLKETGCKVRILKFDKAVQSMTVDEWLGVLIRDYDARFLLVGYDNSFGSDGRGKSVEDIVEIGERRGLEVKVAPQLEGVSSSLIRRSIASGDVERATKMLGRPYSIEGIVMHGRAKGRELGFPTANIGTEPDRLLPLPGVYAADVETEERKNYRSVVNIGSAPTFGDDLPQTVEAHLLGFRGDLYGKKVKVKFLRRIREERKFANLEELTSAIGEDVRYAKEI